MPSSRTDEMGVGPPGWSFSVWVGLPKVGDGAATGLKERKTNREEGGECPLLWPKLLPRPPTDFPPPRLSTNNEQCELEFAPSDVDLETDIDDICIYTHITKKMGIER